MTQVGGFDVSLKIAADYEFMVRCLGQQRLRSAYMAEILVRMRMGGASNRSLSAMFSKSREDLQVLRRHRLGGIGTLALKNIRKLPQFLMRRCAIAPSG